MQKWVVPCNVKIFDIVEHFTTQNTVYFKRNRPLALGDEVYIYLAKPYSEIKYKGVVIKTGIKPADVDKAYKVSCIEDKSFALVELIREFPSQTFPVEELKKQGLGQVVNQSLIRGKIEDYITKIEESL